MDSVESTQFCKIKVLSENETYDQQKILKISNTQVKKETTMET